MVHRDDPDAHESELDERAGRRGRPQYSPTINVEPPFSNRGYLRIVIAWASVITTILILTFAYLWTSRDQYEIKQDLHAEKQDAEIMALWAARAQDREMIGRMESHIEYLQKQVDKMQK